MGSVVLVHDEQYEDTVTLSKEGVTFENSKGTKLYKWEEITNIFNWIRSSVLCVIDIHGNVNCGNIGPSDFKTYEEDIKYIWQEWFKNIPSKDEVKSFEYPDWCLKKEKGSAIRNAFEGICGGIVSWGLGALCLALNIIDSLKTWVLLVSVGIAGLLFFIWSLVNFKKYVEKSFRRISIVGNTVEVTYDEHITRPFDILGKKEFLFQDRTNNVTVVFEDGSKLRYVERVSYWPVLRGYLLSKLEPSKNSR